MSDRTVEASELIRPPLLGLVLRIEEVGKSDVFVGPDNAQHDFGVLQYAQCSFAESP